MHREEDTLRFNRRGGWGHGLLGADLPDHTAIIRTGVSIKGVTTVIVSVMIVIQVELKQHALAIFLSLTSACHVQMEVVIVQ